MQLNGLLAAPGFEQWLEGEPLDPVDAALHRGREAARGDLLDRASRRRRTDVLRRTAAEPDRRLDARAGRNVEPAGHRLHGRDPRILSADRQSAVEGAAADAAEAGACVRDRRGPRDAEPRRPRLQGARRTPAPGSSAACRPSGTRHGCSTASKARPPAPWIAPSVDRLLSALDKRVFLLHNVHADGPVVFQTRWTPVVSAGSACRATRSVQLTAAGGKAASALPPATAPAPAAAAAADPRRRGRRPFGLRPPPRRVPSCLPGSTSSSCRRGGSGAVTYEPVVLGSAQVAFSDAKSGIHGLARRALCREGDRGRGAGGLGKRGAARRGRCRSPADARRTGVVRRAASPGPPAAQLPGLAEVVRAMARPGGDAAAVPAAGPQARVEAWRE